MKTTKWFVMKSTPERIGAYEVRYQDKLIKSFSYWDGLQWCLACDTPLYAKEFSDTRSVDAYTGEIKYWRGLAEKPKSK